MNKTIMLLVVFLLYGCADGSSIVTGIARPAINLEEVKIYLDPPSKYETIGIVEAASDVEISRQAAQDRVINELKSQAALIGANGVLLTNSGSQSSGAVGYSSNGAFYSSTTTEIVGQGKAIYVTKP